MRPHPDKAEPEKGDGLPRTLGGAPVKAGSDAAKLRGTLATWMTAHANPWLAKAAVNRAAARLLGRAFITPADDLTGPGERFAEPVLDLLAQDFEASGYDLHRLERILARTRAYRLASADGEEKADLVTMPVRELPPTVAFRALVQAALPGLADAKEGGPRGLRENNVRRFAVYFDDGLDRPRTQSQGGIQRALWMLNGEPAGDLLRDRKEGLARRIVGANLSTEKAVEEVYLTVLGRLPDDGEERIARAALPAQPEKARVEAIEDLEWALMNGGEFLVNR